MKTEYKLKVDLSQDYNIVGKNVMLGDNPKIGKFCVIGDNVTFGDNIKLPYIPKI